MFNKGQKSAPISKFTYMKLKYLYIFLIIFVALSCEKETQVQELKLSGETITFDVGFPVRDISSFSSDGDEYIAFIDFSTHRKANVFSLDNNFQKIISFSGLMKDERETFTAFYPISIDSFALLAKHTNRVYILDANGETILKKDYSHHLLEGIEMFKPLIIENSVLRTAFGYFPANYSTMDPVEHNKIKINNFIIVEDSLFLTNNNKLTLKFDSIYSRFTKNDEWAIETKGFLVTNDKVILYSSYNDSLYVFNKDYKIKEIIKMTSDFYEKTLRPIKIADAKKNEDLVNERAWNSAMLWKVKYDSLRKLYYCFIRGPHIEKEFPFSIIVLDEEFNKLTEKKFSEKEYKPNGFTSKKGFYLEKQVENIKTRSFELMNYE